MFGGMSKEMLNLIIYPCQEDDSIVYVNENKHALKIWKAREEQEE
jgi:hypothetical protein